MTAVDVVFTHLDHRYILMCVSAGNECLCVCFFFTFYLQVIKKWFEDSTLTLEAVTVFTALISLLIKGALFGGLIKLARLRERSEYFLLSIFFTCLLAPSNKTQQNYARSSFLRDPKPR